MAAREFGRFLWQNLRHFSAEAVQPVVYLTRFLCVLHITNSYLVTPAPIFLESIGEWPEYAPDDQFRRRFDVGGEDVARLGKVKSGDIVLIRSPQNPRKIVTKRVVGMEGKTVSYVAEPSDSDLPETIVVPKGHVWIEGDNVYCSNDSGKFGPVPYGRIVGRVFWRVWPPAAFGPLGPRF